MQYGIIFILLGVLVSLIVSGIKIVPESKVYIVQRLGKYHTQLNAGFHIINPFLDQVIKQVSLKETVKDFAPQPVITKDNATMLIDTVVYFQITAPKLFTYC